MLRQDFRIPWIRHRLFAARGEPARRVAVLGRVKGSDQTVEQSGYDHGCG